VFAQVLVDVALLANLSEKSMAIGILKKRALAFSFVSEHNIR
jgi:hypothetical protein